MTRPRRAPAQIPLFGDSVAPRAGDAVGMATVEVLTTRETESTRIRNWRFEELERAGYGITAATELAERTDVDLHVAVELLRAGCPERTARRILL